MYHPEKIEGFRPKSCYFGPSSNLFYERNAITRADLPYGTLSGASCSDGVTFFGLHLYLAERCCENLKSARRPAQCKFGPGNHTLVGRRNQVLNHFSTAIHLHLASLHATKYF